MDFAKRSPGTMIHLFSELDTILFFRRPHSGVIYLRDVHLFESLKWQTTSLFLKSQRIMRSPKLAHLTIFQNLWSWILRRGFTPWRAAWERRTIDWKPQLTKHLPLFLKRQRITRSPKLAHLTILRRGVLATWFIHFSELNTILFFRRPQWRDLPEKRTLVWKTQMTNHLSLFLKSQRITRSPKLAHLTIFQNLWSWILRREVTPWRATWESRTIDWKPQLTKHLPLFLKSQRITRSPKLAT